MKWDGAEEGQFCWAQPLPHLAARPTPRLPVLRLGGGPPSPGSTPLPISPVCKARITVAYAVKACLCPKKDLALVPGSCKVTAEPSEGLLTSVCFPGGLWPDSLC